MQYLKKYGMKLFYNIIELLLLILFITVLYYFNIIGDKLYSLLKLIILLFTIFINSFSLGKNTKCKGYLEGIKYGIILIILLFIPTFFLTKIEPKLIIYYFLILSSSIFGSMVGISKKKESN